MTGSTPRAPLVPGTTDTYPVLPLRDIVVFPHMIVPLFVGREKSIRALEEVVKNDGLILLATQKNAGDDDPETGDIYEIGTLARVLQLLKLPDSTVKVLVEGIGRAKATANVVYAFGHGHLGLTQSAGTARIVADLLTGKATPIDMAAFSPQRF